MSAPHDNDCHPSLNELINKEDLSLSVTIDSAIKIIKQEDHDGPISLT